MNNTTQLPVTWRKSSYSTNGGNCVETGHGIPNVVPVRDSKATDGPALMFSTHGWDSFLSSVKFGALRD